MKLSIEADVAPSVMEEAMDCMMLALMDERPLNDLERLGWLVICKYIVSRWPEWIMDHKDNERGENHERIV